MEIVDHRQGGRAARTRRRHRCRHAAGKGTVAVRHHLNRVLLASACDMSNAVQTGLRPAPAVTGPAKR